MDSSSDRDLNFDRDLTYTFEVAASTHDLLRKWRH